MEYCNVSRRLKRERIPKKHVAGCIYAHVHQVAAVSITMHWNAASAEDRIFTFEDRLISQFKEQEKRTPSRGNLKAIQKFDKRMKKKDLHTASQELAVSSIMSKNKLSPLISIIR